MLSMMKDFIWVDDYYNKKEKEIICLKVEEDGQCLWFYMICKTFCKETQQNENDSTQQKQHDKDVKDARWK